MPEPTLAKEIAKRLGLASYLLVWPNYAQLHEKKLFEKRLASRREIQETNGQQVREEKQKIKFLSFQTC